MSEAAHTADNGVELKACPFRKGIEALEAAKERLAGIGRDGSEIWTTETLLAVDEGLQDLQRQKDNHEQITAALDKMGGLFPRPSVSGDTPPSSGALVEALRPFAKAADAYSTRIGVEKEWFFGEGTTITIGDLQRAKAALQLAGEDVAGVGLVSDEMIDAAFDAASGHFSIDGDRGPWLSSEGWTAAYQAMRALDPTLHPAPVSTGWQPWNQFEELWDEERAPNRFLGDLGEGRIEICVDASSFDYETSMDIQVEHTRERVWPVGYMPLPAAPQAGRSKT